MENQVRSWKEIRRVLLKAALLFLLLNVLFAWLFPLEPLGRLSVYNLLVSGRTRLPYGEDPAAAYNLSLHNVPAMLASHQVSAPKEADQFRVLLLGDSNTWGWLLPAEETLSAQLNGAGLMTGDGRPVSFYNLGYPIIALSKDLLLLDAAMAAEPDLIIWLVTLDAFRYDKQMTPPLVQHNAPRMQRLIREYDLTVEEDDEQFIIPRGLERTIVGQRRPLADWLRLQLLAVPWAATGIDQNIPDDYELRQSDFDTDISWAGYEVPVQLGEADLAFDLLAAGISRAGDVPVWIVNEPIFISEGTNSDRRYNAFYPRWAYDQYRELIAEAATARGWQYLDLWDRVPGTEFTDTAVHLTPAGTVQLAAAIEKRLAAEYNWASRE